MLHGMYHDELDPGSAVIVRLLQDKLQETLDLACLGQTKLRKEHAPHPRYDGAL